MPATSDSVEVVWSSMDDNIQAEFLENYGYTVQYRLLGSQSWESRDVPAEGSTESYFYQIEGLQANSVYEVQVSPYRQIEDNRETGQPTEILEIKTACGGILRWLWIILPIWEQRNTI